MNPSNDSVVEKYLVQLAQTFKKAVDVCIVLDSMERGFYTYNHTMTNPDAIVSFFLDKMEGSGFDRNFSVCINSDLYQDIPDLKQDMQHINTLLEFITSYDQDIKNIEIDKILEMCSCKPTQEEINERVNSFGEEATKNMFIYQPVFSHQWYYLICALRDLTIDKTKLTELTTADSVEKAITTDIRHLSIEETPEPHSSQAQAKDLSEQSTRRGNFITLATKKDMLTNSSLSL